MFVSGCESAAFTAWTQREEEEEEEEGGGRALRSSSQPVLVVLVCVEHLLINGLKQVKPGVFETKNKTSQADEETNLIVQKDKS